MNLLYAARPRFRLLFLLMLSTVCSIGLVAARMSETNSIAFFFYLWNLFLAIIPFVITSALRSWSWLRKPLLPFTVLFLTWLAFLPNAPYMLTDLFHLKPRPTIPLWYDLVMMLSFALNGLMLCFVSLLDMQEMLREKIGNVLSWGMSLGVLFLSAFGIYLGRYLRWNSWDIVDRPIQLLGDLSDRILHPEAHPQTWGVTLLFAGFLTLGYLIFRELGKTNLLNNPGFPARS